MAADRWTTWRVLAKARVKRGGNWNNNTNNCRVANRNNDSPDNENNNLGFRLVSTTHGKDQRCPIHVRPCPANAVTNMAGPKGLVPRRESDGEAQTAFGEVL